MLNFDYSIQEELEHINSSKKYVDPIYKIDMRKKNNDGFYLSKIRFLPNITPQGIDKENKLYIKREMHYVIIDGNKELSGYYDCQKQFKEYSKCDLCDLFWSYYNNGEKDTAAKLKKNTSYYSYVQIIKDEQNPDFNGKIMIFKYGQTIFDMIKAMMNGDEDTPQRDPFSLTHGFDFKIKAVEKSGYPNYQQSAFLQNSTPITFDGKKLRYQEVDGKTVLNQDDVMAFMEYFNLNSSAKLNDFLPKRYTETSEEYNKIQKIKDIFLNGVGYSNNKVTNNAIIENSYAVKPSLDIPQTTTLSSIETLNTIFGDDE